jgi:lipopolysaccharide biosynthesis glycosyltransferase
MRVWRWVPKWISIFGWVQAWLTVGSILVPKTNGFQVNIASIVDASSSLACLTKVFSIIKSTKNKQSLHFKFLLMPGLSADAWKSAMDHSCFESVTSETKEWNKLTHIHQRLSLLGSKANINNVGFNAQHIFARFYLPVIFSDCDRLLYIDNDAVVTADLTPLFQRPMLVNTFDEALLSLSPREYAVHLKQKRLAERQGNRRRSGTDPSFSRSAHGRPVGGLPGQPSSRLRQGRRSLTSQGNSHDAVVGLVYEKNHWYFQYIPLYFNLTNALVRSAMKFYGEGVFLNGGVILYNAHKWRAENWTDVAERIILSTGDNSIYKSINVGDQGTFFVGFTGHTMLLHASMNMRRLPTKSVQLLDQNMLGIIHFAGTQSGSNPEQLCRFPLLYPVLFNATLPLYFSVVHSFNQSCSGSGAVMTFQLLSSCFLLLGLHWAYGSVCRDGAKELLAAITMHKLTVRYNPGNGQFAWPPEEISAS